MRLQTFYLVNMQLPKEKAIRDPRALMPFDWDDEYTPEEVYIPTAEEWEELDRKYAKGKK
jgi:hypothetical protein